MNATVYSRKRPIEIVIVSAVMVVLALVRIWAHFSDLDIECAAFICRGRSVAGATVGRDRIYI